jgi:hypothetical protein
MDVEPSALLSGSIRVSTRQATHTEEWERKYFSMLPTDIVMLTDIIGINQQAPGSFH